jgi:hypothetical protein
MASSVNGIVYDYTQWAGPYCTDHKSVQCEHAIAEIADRKDAHPLSIFIEEMKPNTGLTVMVPLWTSFYMWEELNFLIKNNSALGNYGSLQSRGKAATFDLGVTKLLRGESAEDLSRTMVQQFEDIMELDRPAKLPGCRSGNHSLKYQSTIESWARDSSSTMRLMPHLYGLLGRETPICAFCWADSYGGDARRVSGIANEAAKADDFSDLLFQG